MDGRDDRIRRLTQEMADRGFGSWFYHEGDNLGYWGHGVRNWVLPIVSTDLVWHLDDDDIATPGALAAIRHSSGRWTIFRMEFGSAHPAHGITCWREPRLMKGDIGTPMVIAPPSKARFNLEYGGDFSYVQDLVDELGPPTWDERVIALIRPENPDGGQTSSDLQTN